MFKIIETVEKGRRRELTIIPGRWEQCGILFWPKKFAYKFQKDPNSAPEPNWISIPCKLKRNFLGSYELAEKELSRMVDAESTTESEEPLEQIPIPKKARRVKVLLPKTQNTDLNDLAASCVMAENNNENYLQSYNFTPPTQIMPEILELDDENHIIDETVAVEVLGNTLIHISEQEEKTNILTTLNTVVKNQHKIMKELASFQVMFDKAMKKKTENLGNTSCDNNYQPILIFEPIDDKKSLQELNDTLKNMDTFNHYVKALSIICGVNTKTKAIDHCYMLVDKFFTRHFFTLCSWAGGAKIPNTKFPFKFHENVITLFFKLINLADSRFTLEECEDFFKGVIRNCIRRNTCLNKRTSKSKNRPKKLCYSIKDKGPQDEGNANTEENEGENDEQVTELSDDEMKETPLSSENTENS